MARYRYVMSAAPPPLQVHLLGPLQVMVAGRRVVVDTRKALAIVALVVAERRPYAREELAAMFWPDADDEAARGALRRTLSALRTALGDSDLRIDRTQVDAGPDVESDLATVERLAFATERSALEVAAALVRGPFLAGFALRDSPAFDDWQVGRAARVEQLVGDLLERLAMARLADGDAGGAIEAARRRVDLDPLHEGGQRQLIEVLARSGDRAGAIAQYRTLGALFERELGVPPLRETTDLYDAIREGTLSPDPTASSFIPGEPASRRSPGTRFSADGPGMGGPAPTGSPPLAGRDVDLARLLEAWRSASADGQLALIEGEAGIGKTRLGEAVAAAIASDGGTVLSSRAYPGESAIAYGPIAELLRAGLSSPGGAARLATLDEIARREIARLVDLPASLRVAGPVAPESPSGRGRLLDAIARAVGALVSGPVPGLVWIDDLHLSDEPTREAVAYLARRLVGRPLLLLLAWRREDLSPAALATANDLGRVRGATLVTLGPLDRAAIAAIVAAVRPGGSGDGTADAVVDALLADSEGLPLHIVEALASGEPAGALPRGVQAIMRDRLASVGEKAGQILSAAAVIGRSFDLSTVRHASGRTEEETVDGLEELIRRGVVREVAGSIGGSVRYDFNHGRLRDAAYDQTSLARRRLLHRRTAEALRLDLVVAGRDRVARFALIGAHEREAGRPAEAAAAYSEAAEQAQALYANREAIGHLEAALALATTGAGSASGPAVHASAAAAHARIGELRARLGEYPAAVTALETAAALAAPADLPVIEIALGRVQRRRGDLRAADSHLASALGAPHLADAVRAAALVERSLVALRGDNLEAADEAARAARLAAAQAADRHLAGVAERLLGLVAQARGDRAAAGAALERSLVLAADDPDPTASIAAWTALALTLASAGQVDDAVTTATRAIEACRRIGDRHLEAAVENHLADICHDAGRADESMEHLKRAVGLFAEVGEGAPEREPGIWSLAAW